MNNEEKGTIQLCADFCFKALTWMGIGVFIGM